MKVTFIGVPVHECCDNLGMSVDESYFDDPMVFKNFKLYRGVHPKLSIHDKLYVDEMILDYEDQGIMLRNG